MTKCVWHRVLQCILKIMFKTSEGRGQLAPSKAFIGSMSILLCQTEVCVLLCPLLCNNFVKSNKINKAFMFSKVEVSFMFCLSAR